MKFQFFSLTVHPGSYWFKCIDGGSDRATNKK